MSLTTVNFLNKRVMNVAGVIKTEDIGEYLGQQAMTNSSDSIFFCQSEDSEKVELVHDLSLRVVNSKLVVRTANGDYVLMEGSYFLFGRMDPLEHAFNMYKILTVTKDDAVLVLVDPNEVNKPAEPLEPIELNKLELMVGGKALRGTGIINHNTLIQHLKAWKSLHGDQIRFFFIRDKIRDTSEPRQISHLCLYDDCGETRCDLITEQFDLDIGDNIQVFWDPHPEAVVTYTYIAPTTFLESAPEKKEAK